MTTSRRILGAVAAAGAAALVLSGCVAKSDVAAGAAFDVSSTDSECAVSATTAESGTLTSVSYTHLTLPTILLV